MTSANENRTRYPGIYEYTIGEGDHTEIRFLYRIRDREGRGIKKRGFTSMSRAREARSEVEAEIRSGSYAATASGRVTVSECWEHYRDAKKTRLKPSSLHSLERSWASYVQPRWGKTQVSKVSRRAVQQWATALTAGERVPTSEAARSRQTGGTRSASVVIRAVEVLRGALQVAVDDRRIAANPAKGVELPRKGKGKTGAARRYLARTDVRAVADACLRPSDRCLFLVLALGGLRWGEAVGLRVEDVDVTHGRLHVRRSVSQVGGVWHETEPKTWERRSVPIPRHLADELYGLIADRPGDELVFPSPQNPASFRTLPRHVAADAPGRPQWLQAALGRAGVPYLSPHDLRHTAASLAVQSGASVKAVQRMLGHESASMTLDVYSDLFDSDLDEVAQRADAAWEELEGALADTPA
jgi:integrase